MDLFQKDDTVSWTNKKGDYTGKIVELKKSFAIIEVGGKSKRIPYKILKKEDDEKQQPQNVTNALFVGSTAELQKMISGRNDDV